MATFSAIAVKRYLETTLGTLLTDYQNGIAIVYGPPASDDMLIVLVIGNVEYEESNYDTHGARMKVYEIYNIACDLWVEQKDGTAKDTDETAEDLFEIISEEIRNDPTLGGNIHFVKVTPETIASGPLAQGGAATLWKFNVRCQKQLA